MALIPEFPEFKKLSYSDKDAVESYLHGYPVYSDFDFASLWSWNVKEDMEISDLNGNLVIRFTDYLTGEPFFTFIGDRQINETVDTLLDFSVEKGYGDELRLVPEISTEGLDPDRFVAAESRDHFDYVLALGRYLTYSGGALKSRRNFLNSFKKSYPHYQAVKLDLTDPKIRKEVTDLYRNWQERKGFLSLSESFAYDRFLDIAHDIEHTAVGLIVDGKIVAFHVSALPKNTSMANGLFEKADANYPGIYQALMHEVSKDLLERDRTHLNYEQDLGMEGLRRSKSAFDPVHFLKKYVIRRKTEGEVAA